MRLRDELGFIAGVIVMTLLPFVLIGLMMLIGTLFGE